MNIRGVKVCRELSSGKEEGTAEVIELGGDGGEFGVVEGREQTAAAILSIDGMCTPASQGLRCFFSQLASQISKLDQIARQPDPLGEIRLCSYGDGVLPHPAYP